MCVQTCCGLLFVDFSYLEFSEGELAELEKQKADQLQIATGLSQN
jgi:hypothetical protein